MVLGIVSSGPGMVTVIALVITLMLNLDITFQKLTLRKTR